MVVSYTGHKGADTSGADYTRGELVETGCRGVWRDPMMPGKYAFNTYAGKIGLVPTTNFVLMWQSGSSGSNFDSNLREITLITKDAFEPLLRCCRSRWSCTSATRRPRWWCSASAT